MKLYNNYICLIILWYCLDVVYSENKELKKLQIGIKKRAENCNVKSKKGDLLHVQYTGTFENGEEFDSSGDRTFTFTLGSGQVIKGWDQGLIGMCVSEHRKLVVPPYLAYKEEGVPPTIPSNSTLIFYVKLIKIEKRNCFFQKIIAKLYKTQYF